MMYRVTFLFAMAGMAIAASLSLLAYILNSFFRGVPGWLQLVYLFLWPFSLATMAWSMQTRYKQLCRCCF